mgnify:CR=1 FL=1|tara:strand:+ start:172290 stop:173192 length:903 start_codon:yes stop_codon:yes gene_type:complete
MDFFIPTITIIGFGETGSLIGSLVNHGKQNIKINILDPDPDVEGKILDLKHAAIPKNNEISLNDRNLFSKSQLIFYTAGVRGKAGSSRNQNAAENKAIIRQVFKGQKIKKSALIVTISNPVESIAMWIHKEINGGCTILSTGTLLDTYRLKTILSERFKMSQSFIDTLVIGEHGSEMIPLWSQTTIKNENISKLIDKDELQIIERELKNTATKIRQTQDATKYGVAETALVVANQFFSSQSVLMPITYFDPELTKDDIFISWPVFIGKQHLVPTNLKLSAQEKEAWNRAVESIHNTTNSI